MNELGFFGYMLALCLFVLTLVIDWVCERARKREFLKRIEDEKRNNQKEGKNDGT